MGSGTRLPEFKYSCCNVLTGTVIKPLLISVASIKKKGQIALTTLMSLTNNK